MEDLIEFGFYDNTISDELMIGIIEDFNAAESNSDIVVDDYFI